MPSQQTMISDELIEHICSAVKGLQNKDDVVTTIVDTLIDCDVDLRCDPSLEEMKRILAEAYNSISCKSATV